MIDLSRIRSLKTLDEMTGHLNEFINNPDVVKIYVEDYGWGVEDYEDDKGEAIELLAKIEARRLSLDKYLKGQAGKPDSQRKPKLETATTPSEQ